MSRDKQRLALQCLGLGMLVVSLPSLYWWSLLVLTSAPLHIRTDSLLTDLYRFYLIVGGSLGWVSLAGLAVLQYLRPRSTPPWLVIGSAIGISAAILIAVELPRAWYLAAAPVAAASCLLARGALLTQNLLKDGHGT